MKTRKPTRKQMLRRMGKYNIRSSFGKQSRTSRIIEWEKGFENEKDEVICHHYNFLYDTNWTPPLK